MGMLEVQAARWSAVFPMASFWLGSAPYWSNSLEEIVAGYLFSIETCTLNIHWVFDYPIIQDER